MNLSLILKASTIFIIIINRKFRIIEIKEKIYNLNTEYFKRESIVDLDIKTSGIKTNKRSFMDLEITLYVDKHFDVRSKDVKNIVSNLSENIVDTILVDETLFNFFEKKN